MIAPRVAYALGRLLAVDRLNGELDALPEQFRDVGHRLYNLPLENRQPVWEDFLESRSDREAIIMAMSGVEPLGPPPAGVDTVAAADPGSSRSNDKPGSNPAPCPSEKTFANFDWVTKDTPDGEKRVMEARRVQEIDAAMLDVAGPWPKRVGSTLFIEGSDLTPVYLDSPTQLIAYADSLAQVDWHAGDTFVTQQRYFEHLRRTVEHYEAIETLPHYPALPATYYMVPPVPRRTVRDGQSCLDRLLKMFTPESEVDRALIRALILTIYWGGARGLGPRS